MKKRKIIVCVTFTIILAIDGSNSDNFTLFYHKNNYKCVLFCIFQCLTAIKSIKLNQNCCTAQSFKTKIIFTCYRLLYHFAQICRSVFQIERNGLISSVINSLTKRMFSDCILFIKHELHISIYIIYHKILSTSHNDRSKRSKSETKNYKTDNVNKQYANVQLNTSIRSYSSNLITLPSLHLFVSSFFLL